MNAKKVLLLTTMVAAGSAVFAQSSNVKKAGTNIQKYEELRAAGTPQLGTSYLKTAQEAIDAAAINDKSKDLPETWTYYALVYSSLAADNKSDEDATKAADALEKAKALDKDSKNAQNIKAVESNLYSYNFNKGVGFWDGKDFKSAYSAFNSALTYVPGDTTLTYYSALAAIQNNDYPNGIEKYKELIPKKEFSAHKSIVADLPKLYLSIKDTSAAIEYAAVAAKEYPNDKDIVVQNIELNLIVGNEAKIADEIEKQITKDGNNKNLYYYLGIAQNANNKPQEALAAYQKPLKLIQIIRMPTLMLL